MKFVNSFIIYYAILSTKIDRLIKRFKSVSCAQLVSSNLKY